MQKPNRRSKIPPTKNPARAHSHCGAISTNLQLPIASNYTDATLKNTADKCQVPSGQNRPKVLDTPKPSAIVRRGPINCLIATLTWYAGDTITPFTALRREKMETEREAPQLRVRLFDEQVR